MKSKAAVVVIMSLILLCLAQVSVAEMKRWENPLFKKLSVTKSGPFVKLSDGDLMIVEGNTTLTSKDNGKTWSKPRPVYEGEPPGIPRIDSQVLKTRDGVIVLVYNDKSTYYWEWDDSRGEPKGEPRLDVWAIRSFDEGRVW